MNPFDDPEDPAYRPPLDPSLPFPPQGKVDHPNLKELLYTNLNHDQTVLDVGCGPGPFEYKRYEPKFLAYDMFEPESEEGLKKGLDEFRLGKLESFPIEDGSCDAVVMGFILEHVEDPLSFLKEAERVLVPGGWCYVSIPNYRSFEDRLFRLATTIAGSKRGPHIQKFTKENFKRLVHQNTGLRLRAYHILPGSFMWMMHPKMRPFRKPLLRFLSILGMLGVELRREANYQFLLYKKS